MADPEIFDPDLDELKQFDSEDNKLFVDQGNKLHQERTLEDEYEESNYWFLIMILMLFVFFLALGAVMASRAYRERRQMESVGYVS